MKAAAVLVMIVLTGCSSVGSGPPQRTMTSEEALGTFFLISSLSGQAAGVEFLSTVYPVRSQLVTFAVIGFHRDRGAWPTSEKELLDYAASSLANPPLPSDSVAGLVVESKEDGGIVYSTLEDRQRGRAFTVSSTYRVTFPVPSYPFASTRSGAAPGAAGSTISFDWGAAIVDALSRLAFEKK